MIGQLINEFDASMDNSLAAFNELFKMELEGDDSAEIRIGRALSGGLRELFINDERAVVELKESLNVLENLRIEPKQYYIYEVYFKGKFYNKYTSYSHLAYKFSCSPKTMITYTKDGRSYFGFTIKKVDASRDEYYRVRKVKLNLPIRLNMKNRETKHRGNSGRKNLYVYYFRNSRKKEQKSDSLTNLALDNRLSKKALEGRLRTNNTKFKNGWSIRRELKGE